MILPMCVGQRLRLLSRELETLADGAGGGMVEDESEDLHLGTAERAQERVDLGDGGSRPSSRLML